MKGLRYEKLNESFIEDLLHIWADEEVIRYTNIKAPCTLEEIRKRINRLKDFEVFAVIHEDEFIGIIGCPCIDENKVDYGVFYQFSKSNWGKGYATIAMKWLLNFMRDKYDGITFFADVVIDNVASEKILKNFGFKLISEEGGFERNGIKSKIHSYKL